MNENGPQQAHPAAVAQEFMRRTDMKGGEVEAYAQTYNWLAQVIEGQVVCTPQEAHQAMVDELVQLREDVRLYNETFGPLPDTMGEDEGEDVEEDVPTLEPLEDVESEASE
jgi:hypothetical protein